MSHAAKAAASPVKDLLQVARESEDTASVRAALMQLGYESSDEVYQLLVEKLNDPNPSIQHAAVIALGRFGRPGAIEELAKPKIFHSPFHQIRWAAVTAVGRLGDYRVIDLLLKAAEDAEWIVRTQAVTELMAKVRDIIARRDPRLARILIYMFALDNDEIVDLAMAGFQELGGACVDWLNEALRNPSPNIRANAARTLGRMKSQGSTPYLVELLQDESSAVRASATEALGRIGNRASIEPLVVMVQDNVEDVQETAVTALVGFGKAATVPILNALTRERDKFALRAFLNALGRIGDPKSIPALISYLRSSYFIVRQTAAAALVRFGAIIIPHLLAALSFNASDIEALKRDACDREHPELQLRAIKALGGLEDHRAVSLLKELVEKGLPDIQEAASQALSLIGCAAWGRCCALRVLGDVGDKTIVPAILPSLKDDSDNVRFEAVRALGKLGGDVAVTQLVLIARKDCRDFIRREAVRLLRTAGQGRPDVLATARQRLRDASRDVRVQAARLLGGFQDETSVPALLKAMADPHWSVRESAEIALLNFGPAVAGVLIKGLKSPSWTTRFRSARLLGEIGAPEGIAPLENALGRARERKDVREIIESSLRRLKK
ncbi:MAG TPA: HEAT repeat domain-containing protein [Acidobacteriota bacterium]|nr:HEAT repeat domain-containing protein [Acidobacteriota bacterium]